MTRRRWSPLLLPLLLLLVLLLGAPRAMLAQLAAPAGGHSFIMMRDDVREIVPRFLGSGVMPAGVGRVKCGG